MSEALIAGDVDVIEISIRRFNSDVKHIIRDQVKEIVIYESLFSKFLHGYLLIEDASGLLSNFPVIGEEIVTIKYRIKDNNQRRISGEFAVFEVAEVSKSEDNKSQGYQIKFTSIEKFRDVTGGVSNPYELKICQIIQRIVKEGLYSTKPIEVEECVGLQDFVFPNSIPSEAINFCMARAVSTKNRTSSYVFYEALNDGFVFKTIEQMIKDGRDDPDEYFMFPDRSKQSKDLDFFNITSFSFDSRFNTLSKIKNGMVDSELIRYDLITKKQSTNRYKYREIFNDYAHLDPRAPGRMLTDEFLLDYEDNSKFHATRNEYSYIVEDTSRPDTHLEHSYGHKRAFYDSLKQIQGTIATFGLPNRKAGDIIKIKIPPMEGSTDISQDQEKFISGNFLVTNVKHIILNNTKYSMVLDITKDCYRTPINV